MVTLLDTFRPKEVPEDGGEPAFRRAAHVPMKVTPEELANDDSLYDMKNWERLDRNVRLAGLESDDAQNLSACLLELPRAAPNAPARAVALLARACTEASAQVLLHAPVVAIVATTRTLAAVTVSETSATGTLSVAAMLETSDDCAAVS